MQCLVRCLAPLGVAAILVLFSACAEEPAALAPPSPDLGGAEAPVAAVLRGARGRVVAEPGSAEAWGAFGMLLDAHDLVEEAQVAYREAARLDPRDGRWPYLQATAMPDAPPRERLALLERAREKLGPGMALDLRRGDHLLQAGLAEEARAAFEAARLAAPTASHPLLGLGRAALALDDPVTARRHLEQAVRLDPSHGEAWAELSRARMRTEDPAGAAEASDRAGRLPRRKGFPDPLRQEVGALRANGDRFAAEGFAALEAGRPLEAEKLFRRALAGRPAECAWRAGLAGALDQQGRADEAGKLLEDLVSEDPACIEGLRYLGRHHAVANDLARAREFLARAVAADPDRGDVRRDLAIVLMRMDHYPAALALLEQGVDREVVPGDLHNMLAWLLATLPDAALRNGVRALGLAEAVRAADPAPVPNHLGTLAAALAEAGRFEEAAETLGQGVAAALAAGDGPWVGAARERLAAYQAGRPWYSWSH